MEVPRHNLEFQYQDLVERIQTVAMGPEFQPDRIRQRLEEFNFWPSKDMKVSELGPMETYVRLIEAVGIFQTAETKTKAKNKLAHSVTLARQLDEQLPGNDEAVRFFIESTTYLNETNPELAEDVSRVLMRVYDEGKFSQ